MNTTRQTIGFVACAAALAALGMHTSRASDDGPFIQWHSENIQLLRGTGYELGESERTIATFEHANSWKYGDFFMFVDVTRFDSGEFGAYGEASPRFSFLKMAGSSPLNGFVKDFLVSTTYEKGEEGVQTFLYGAGLDFNIPGFSYFKTNLYVRDNPNLSDETWQVTLSWQYPFSLGPVNFVTEGFADFAGSAEPRYHSNQLIAPRLLMDVGDLVGLKKGRLWTGVEYTYWHNKFGVDGVTESVPQLQIKWVF